MVSVSPVKLPFSVKIKHTQETDHISLLIEGEKKCKITYYICVAAKELYKAVEEKKCTSERKLVDVLNLISLWITEPQYICFSDEGSYLHKLSYNLLPLDVRERLTEVLHDSASQELSIPLLMCIQLDGNECTTLIDDNSVVSIVTAITTSTHGPSSSTHGSFSSSPGSTSFLSGGSDCSFNGSGQSPDGVLKYNITQQYMETLDGRVFLLKKLYKSGVDKITDDTETSGEQPHTSADQQPTESNELCLICQEYPVTRALLPCRHLCVCRICFSKVKLCPVCRTVITSFCIVKNEDDIPEVEPVVQNNDDISSLIQNEGIWSFIKSIWNAS